MQFHCMTRDVIFLGGVYGPQLLKHIHDSSRGHVGFSNHNFEIKLIQGLVANSHMYSKFSVVSAPKVYSFPKYNKQAWLKEEKWNISSNCTAWSVGFCNIVGVNKLVIPASVYQAIKALVLRSQADIVHLIVNTPSYYLLKAISKIKKKFGDKIFVSLIVPDMPQFISLMDKRNKMISLIIDRIDARTMQLSKQVDAYVLLTDAMADLMSIRDRPYIIMEGVCEDAPIINETPSLSEKTIILYTGTLRYQFGVIDLLNAFERIEDENVELWICGSGDAEDEIKERALNDNRIKFYGLLDAQAARELQQMATILVNPRTNEGDYTRYSFPSKTLEYMLAGKPVVMHKLDGIPQEYDNYIYFTESDNVDGLFEKLQYVLKLPEQQRRSKAELAKQFVMQYKNATKQTCRILELCNKNKK